jgi:atlastin
MGGYSGSKGVGAVPIVLSDDEHTFDLDEIALEKVLLRDDIKDLPVAVVSVAGAFRKGKSFLLDFFIRYLRAGVRNPLFPLIYPNTLNYRVAMTGLVMTTVH